MSKDRNDPAQLTPLIELFGMDIVEQAELVDVVDLNLDDRMTSSISSGVTGLKRLRGDLTAQRRFVDALQPGERLLLCMWILEMDLLDKVRD